MAFNIKPVVEKNDFTEKPQDFPTVNYIALNSKSTGKLGFLGPIGGHKITLGFGSYIV